MLVTTASLLLTVLACSTAKVAQPSVKLQDKVTDFHKKMSAFHDKLLKGNPKAEKLMAELEKCSPENSISHWFGIILSV